jgi:monovalent cation:H+ antiporter-2, CPA2 family
MTHDVPLLRDLLTLLLLAVPVALLCHRLRLPTIIGFMLVGVLSGPHGLRLVTDVDAVNVLAEIGVALLLFVIGLEFSFQRLLRMRRLLFVGGGLQVLLTITLAAGLLVATRYPFRQAVLAGFLLALSSTALVLRSYQERAEIDAPHGRVALGILLFQDLCIIPMMILVPVLAGSGGDSFAAVGLALVKAVLALLIIVAAARLAVPFLLRRVVRLRSSEVFIITTALVVFGTSWLTAQVGLSLSIGAFIAGLVLSESDYSHQVVADFLPFRDLFISLFFVSLGMLLSLEQLLERLPLVLIVVLGLIGLKLLTGSLAVRLLGYPPRVALLTGIGLAQVGEFSFVLAREGVLAGLLSAGDYQVFLGSAIISMAATPLLIGLAPRLAFAGDRSREGTADESASSHPALSGHVIIAGFGVNGRNLSRVLRSANIEHLVLELNADRAEEAMSRGEPVLYGDATRREMLHRARIAEARVLVLAISDPLAARHIVVLARALNQRIQIIVRTRYVHELPDLLKLGADSVIPEEFETSIQISARVLQEFEISQDDIGKLVEEVRREGYQILRR